MLVLLIVGAVANGQGSDGFDAAAQARDLFTGLAQPAAGNQGLDLETAITAGTVQRQNCPASDPACQALRLGLTPRPPSEHAPGRLDKIFKDFSFDPNLELGTCVAGPPRQRAKPGGANLSCLEDGPLTAAVIAPVFGTLASLSRSTSYMYFTGAQMQAFLDLHGNTYAFVGFVLTDLSLYASFELVLVEAPSLSALTINTADLALGTTNDTPICIADLHEGCEPLSIATLEELPVQNAAAGLVVGYNYIALVFTGPIPPAAGVLFRLRLKDDATGWQELPQCGNVVEEGCVYVNEDEQRCGQWSGDVCLRPLRSYSCAEGLPDQEVVRCGAPTLCRDGSCTGTAEEGSNGGDLVQALAWLEMGRQAGAYMDRDDLRVFRGRSSTCRNKIAGGLGDCCRGADTGGPTTNSAALAQLGISLAIRGVNAKGSPHTHDLLFLSDDLSASLTGLGAGGLATTFSPSLSYYGLEVALTDGVFTLGFDPASFAVAVALAVLGNLLECNSQEQALGLKVGAGLCVLTRTWCETSLGFCLEEKERHCCYNSKLARLFATQAQGQLRLSASRCEGFTVEQLAALDFSQIDLSDFVRELSPAVDESLLERYRADNAARLQAAKRQKNPRLPVL